MHMQLLRDIPCAGYISYIENFHIHSMHLDIIKVFFSSTDARANCPKSNFKIYIKTGMKKSPTYFGVVTPSSGSALLVRAKVTVVKIAN